MIPPAPGPLALILLRKPPHMEPNTANGANSPSKSPRMDPAPIVINVTKKRPVPKPKCKAISPPPPPPACTECEQYSALITEHKSLQDKYTALETELAAAKDEIAAVNAELAAAQAQLNLDLLRKFPDPPVIAADGSSTYTMKFVSMHRDTVCFANPDPHVDFRRIYVPHSLLGDKLLCQQTITVNIGRTGDYKLRLIKMAKGSGDDAYAADAFSGSIYLPHKYRQFNDLFLSLKL